jgi:hypothetical protein
MGGKSVNPAVANLEGKVVIVRTMLHTMKLDKPPSSAFKKAPMQQWLSNHSIAFDANFTKKKKNCMI